MFPSVSHPHANAPTTSPLQAARAQTCTQRQRREISQPRAKPWANDSAEGRSGAVGETTRLPSDQTSRSHGPASPTIRAAPSANGAKYYSLGRSPRWTTQLQPFPLCRRPEWSRRRNDPNCVPIGAPRTRHGHEILSTPQPTPNPPKPLYPLAIYISKTWHSYPVHPTTIEVDLYFSGRSNPPHRTRTPITPMPLLL